MVKAILPFCASSKTSIHNHVFLEGVKAALIADLNWKNGNYKKQPITGLKSIWTCICWLGFFTRFL